MREPHERERGELTTQVVVCSTADEEPRSVVAKVCRAAESAVSRCVGGERNGTDFASVVRPRPSSAFASGRPGAVLADGESGARAVAGEVAGRSMGKVNADDAPGVSNSSRCKRPDVGLLNRGRSLISRSGPPSRLSAIVVDEKLDQA